MPNFVLVYNPSGLARSDEIIKDEMRRRLTLERTASCEFLDGKLRLIYSEDKYITRTTIEELRVTGGVICAGNVLLESGSSPIDEINDVAFDVVQNSYNNINRSRGRYCGVVWARVDGNDIVSLFVDRVGTRPLYYSKTIDGQYIISTEEILLVNILDRIGDKVSVSLPGLLSKMLLGWVAGNKTCYSGINVLRGSTIVKLTALGAEPKRYWRWPEAVASESETDDLAKRAAEIFLKSLELRLPSDSGMQRAFLSGGLDSRLIAGGLRVLGKDVSTYTFSRKDALDMVLAASFAQASGTRHHATTLASFNLGDGLPSHFRNKLHQEGVSNEEWVSVWSGVGGSGVLGYVDQTATMTHAMHMGNYGAAISEYLKNKHALPARGLTTAIGATALQMKLADELCKELELGDYIKNEKKLCHFLLDNMERTHENNDVAKLERNKIDYIMPFYDPEFVEIMFRVPFSVCDRHKFFIKVMERLDPKLLSVPWQAYPGHIESPIELPEGYTRQWSRRQEPEEKKAIKERVVKGLRFVWSDRFPNRTFHRVDSICFLLIEYLFPGRKSGIERQVTSIADVFGNVDRDVSV